MLRPASLKPFVLLFVLLFCLSLACGAYAKQVSWQEFSLKVDIAGDTYKISQARDLIHKRFGAAEHYAPDVILVKYKEAVPRATAESQIHNQGNNPDKYFKRLNLHKVKLKKNTTPVDALVDLLADPNVEYAEPDYRVSSVITPNDPSYNVLWGMPHINAPSAWNVTTGGGQIVIGVIDTGSDQDHTDLSANFWRNSSGYTGWNAVNNTNNPEDDHYHGTHVAGTIGAVGNNGIGVAGVNWNCKIMSLKFLSSGGWGYISDAIECLDYVITQKTAGVDVRLTSNSWGGGGYSQAMYDAIRNQMNHGILFVAAAGNSNSNNDVYDFYPSDYDLPNVISVAAISSSGDKASFSSYGSQTVHLAAPGVSIYSTMPGNSYGYLSGTSMATPHVSGALGLLLSSEPQLTWSQAKERLLSSVTVTPAMTGKVITNGVLDVSRMLRNESHAILLARLPIENFDHLVNSDIPLAALWYGPDKPDSITAVITLAGGDTTLALNDDGAAPDEFAGDNIYSAVWTPHTSGAAAISYQVYGLSATVNGTVSAGKTWYVNDASTVGDVYCGAIGDNANTGLSPNSPVRSFSAIQDRVGRGDTVLLDAGYYYENDYLYVQHDYFSMIGADSASTVISFGDSNMIPHLTCYGNPDRLILRDFRVTGGAYGIMLYGITNAAIERIRSDYHQSFGLRVSQSNNNRFSDLLLRENGYAGFYSYQNTRNIYENLLCDSNTIGVDLTDDDRTTLRNSVIRNNTNNGVSCYYTVSSTIENNLVTGNTYSGIHVSFGDHNAVCGNTVKSNNSGIVLANNTVSDTVSGNTVIDNLNYGISVNGGARYNTVSGNDISGRHYYGMYISSSDSNLISANRSHHNPNSGIALYNAANNRLAGNQWSDNSGAGIYAYRSSRNVFSRELASGNASYGIYFYDADNNVLEDIACGTNAMYGVYLNRSDTMTLARVTAINNRRQGFYITSSNNNLLRECLADSNADDGYYISSYCLGNLFLNDTAARNRDDGFSLYQVSDRNTFTGCRAEGNRSRGMYLYYSGNQMVTDGVFDRNQYGIMTSGAARGNWFTNNVVTYNSLDGIFVAANGDTNLFRHNRLADNYRYGLSIASSRDNMVINNTIDSNASYGIMVSGEPENSIVVKNNIIPSPHDTSRGIYISSPGSLKNFVRNWWGTDDRDAIAARITGPAAGSVIWQPYRLGRVDHTLTQDTVAPAAPVIRSADMSTGGVIVTWDIVQDNEDSGGAATDIRGYRIYRSTSANPGTVHDLIDTVTAAETTYVDSSHPTVDTYYYRITAYDDHSPDENQSWFSDAGMVYASPISAIAGTVLFANARITGNRDIIVILTNMDGDTLDMVITNTAGDYQFVGIYNTDTVIITFQYPGYLGQSLLLTDHRDTTVAPQRLVGGDLDADADVDNADLARLMACLNQPAEVFPQADLDANNRINITDLSILTRNLSN